MDDHHLDCFTKPELTSGIIFGALKEEALVVTNYMLRIFGILLASITVVVAVQFMHLSVKYGSGYLNLAPCELKTWGAVFFECAGTCVVARYGNTCLGITYLDVTWWPWNVLNSGNVNRAIEPNFYAGVAVSFMQHDM
ncbi:hypothetical protein E2542_SST28155 [Spatholobus suberectus]|nr:hypothetical protein E2542_SST28155 [Spatholobus suberectus]